MRNIHLVSCMLFYICFNGAATFQLDNAIRNPARLSTKCRMSNAMTEAEDMEYSLVQDEASEKEKELPKYSKSIPFLLRPKELKQELAGDVGFDPLNFARNRESLYEYREAEVKHARLAMLAAAGWPISELFDKKIASLLNLDPVVDDSLVAPTLLNNGVEKISPIWWGFCLGLTAAIDLYGVSRARTVENYIPGDLGFDPLGLYPLDEEGRTRMQLAEIKHGRLAMIAVLAFSVQEIVSSEGVVRETPFFFEPLNHFF